MNPTRNHSAERLDSVGFIGLGRIGLPLASLLAKSGIRVLGVDPAPERAGEARSQGIEVIEDASLLSGLPVVFVMVANECQVTSVLAKAPYADAAMADSLLVMMSTIGPRAAREIAAVAQAVGVSVVDCPVTGGVGRAAEGDLTVFLAGNSADVDRIAPILHTFGRVVGCGGHVGDGQSFKMVNNMLATTHLVAAAEAIALARHLGLDLPTVLGVLPTGTAESWMLRDRGTRLIDTEAHAIPWTYLEILAKDADLVVETAVDSGFSAPIATANRQQWAQAIEAGLGRMDDTAIIELYEPARHSRSVRSAGRG